MTGADGSPNVSTWNSESCDARRGSAGSPSTVGGTRFPSADGLRHAEWHAVEAQRKSRMERFMATTLRLARPFLAPAHEPGRVRASDFLSLANSRRFSTGAGLGIRWASRP